MTSRKSPTREPFPPFKIVYDDGLVEHHDPGAGTLTLSLQRPSRVVPGMSCAQHDESPSIHHHSDRGLAEYVVHLCRIIEDAERWGRPCSADKLVLNVAVALQHVRFRFRCRYHAADAYGPPGDRGTDRMDHWLRHDERPSYALAFSIDRRRFEDGRSHVVAWAGSALPRQGGGRSLLRPLPSLPPGETTGSCPDGGSGRPGTVRTATVRRSRRALNRDSWA